MRGVYMFQYISNQYRFQFEYTVKGVISWILEVRASGSTCVLPPCIGSALEFRSSETKVRAERFWRDVGGGSEMIRRRRPSLLLCVTLFLTFLASLGPPSLDPLHP